MELLSFTLISSAIIFGVLLWIMKTTREITMELVGESLFTIGLALMVGGFFKFSNDFDSFVFGFILVISGACFFVGSMMKIVGGKLRDKAIIQEINKK